jgi:predicted transposase/invertase (TIGR01784 family)
MEPVFINGKVVKKILNSEKEECREYLVRIISGVLNVDIETIRNNIELIEPDVSSNINSVDSKVDSIYKTKDNYINIEINYNNKRIVTIKNNIYLYNMILRQIGRSKEYNNVLPVIQININNYDIFKEGRFVYESKIREKENGKVRDEMITIYDINLEYLKKIDYNEIIEGNYNLEKILYIFICNNKEELDYIYKGDEVMEKIREDFDYIKQALDDMLYYNPEELERQADEYEREMARKEGREEGRQETMKGIVLNLYENKFSITDICKYTKLSEKDITNIINK